MKREDETTLQCDPSDGIVATVTNVQALVVRVPAYTSWIIELCLISSTVRKAFSCTSQRCDLLWCIYVSMFLIMYIFYLVSFLSSFGHSLAIKYLHSIAWAWSSAATVFALEGSTEASAANVFSSWGSCLSSSSSTTEMMMKQC